MPSTYYIFDLTSGRSDLDVTLKTIASQYERLGATFMPVFNSDKTKILVQVKERFRIPRELQRVIIGSGDVAWANNLARLPEWQQELTPELNDKTIDYLQGRTTIDIFIQDVKVAKVDGGRVR